MNKIPVSEAAPNGAPLFRGIFLVLGIIALMGCDARPTLNIYNWTYYTPDSIIEKFEKEYNVRINYDVFESNEELFTKLTTGGLVYDIVFPSGDYVSIMIKEDMLEPINKSLLKNLGNIDPLILQKASYDPGMNYSVPYYWGAAGITVNTARVPDFERSWNIFSRKDLDGRMTMLDDMREVLGDALVSLGYSVNTANPAEIAAARDLVNTVWKPNLIRFDATAYGKSFAQEDFWVCQGYPEEVFTEITDSQKEHTVFFIPPEGGPAYIDSMCILKGSKNVELAHQFIDFIHRPEIYAEFADYFSFPATANVPARALQKVTPMYRAEDLANTELKDDVGENLSLYDDAWLTVKVGK
ncbi:MAG: extracellular solute-binding protein [Spirochaetaceae bacterium]|jgi:spermidine/putrescine transport system substrate-binding protein|nr:extracellular solute-binding protein [Spirochaetaceae bacterium]